MQSTCNRLAVALAALPTCTAIGAAEAADSDADTRSATAAAQLPQLANLFHTPPPPPRAPQ